MWVRIRADQLEMNNNIIEHVTSLKPVVESNVHLLKYSALKRSSLQDFDTQSVNVSGIFFFFLYIYCPYVLFLKHLNAVLLSTLPGLNICLPQKQSNVVKNIIKVNNCVNILLYLNLKLPSSACQKPILQVGCS